MYFRPALVLEYMDFVFQNLLLALSFSLGNNLIENGFDRITHYYFIHNTSVTIVYTEFM